MATMTFKEKNSDKILKATFPDEFSLGKVALNYGKDIIIISYVSQNNKPLFNGLSDIEQAKGLMREQINNWFHISLGQNITNDPIIDLVIDDVLATSAYGEAGEWSTCDITLACQRVILIALEQFNIKETDEYLPKTVVDALLEILTSNKCGLQLIIDQCYDAVGDVNEDKGLNAAGEIIEHLKSILPPHIASAVNQIDTIKCDECSGTALVSCQDCGEEGCGECGNSGLVSCQACGGSGEVAVLDVVA